MDIDPNDPRLTGPNTKKGRVQRDVLALLIDHQAKGEIPTNIRFIFYELVQVGKAMKAAADDTRKNTKRSVGPDAKAGMQDITDAATHLRVEGIIPWSWIEDETRNVAVWDHAPTVLDYVRDRLAEATINPWPDTPPLILCESRATAGVLRSAVSRYACPIAGTAGQTAGFLHVEIAPLLDDNDRRVLYLGDLDKPGADIEANTRRVLEDEVGRVVRWRRLGLTEEQAEAAGIPVNRKEDGRDGIVRDAIEVESLGQTQVVALVTNFLDDLLPEPLADVLEREAGERADVRRLLDLDLDPDLVDRLRIVDR